ncbi:ABC transporter substrate-binding protein [Vibrio rotiferianus]|uniref:ABC transporter substrate-binding protein n=1 Tax=Vibrio rotiferianus TaxID=190895 RepID=A0ABX3D326_9VIBR|nr:ABC transporter substrate-binding protein [Vibrio rotiferianus]OHY88688.1 ABC transporter substrate-binding protein [Vibrio rotiferianus]
MALVTTIDNARKQRSIHQLHRFETRGARKHQCQSTVYSEFMEGNNKKEKLEKMPHHSGKAEIANTEAGYFAPLILLTQQLGGWSVLFM